MNWLVNPNKSSAISIFCTYFPYEIPRKRSPGRCHVTYSKRRRRPPRSAGKWPPPQCRSCEFLGISLISRWFQWFHYKIQRAFQWRWGWWGCSVDLVPSDANVCKPRNTCCIMLCPLNQALTKLCASTKLSRGNLTLQPRIGAKRDIQPSPIWVCLKMGDEPPKWSFNRENND